MRSWVTAPLLREVSGMLISSGCLREDGIAHAKASRQFISRSFESSR